jgi:hypothetical protein
MTAHPYLIDHVEFTINPFGAVFLDRNILDPPRSLVFLFTGHLAGFTAPAGLGVNDQFVSVHNRASASFFSG